MWDCSVACRLERVSLARLLGAADIVSLAAGEELCRAGDAGDALFIVAALERTAA